VLAPGVKPELVERWTLYFVTATLSVDAVQLSVTLPVAPTALRPVGALGATVSSLVSIGSIAATDGTPLPLRRKT
jgi:hypothetical protein